MQRIRNRAAQATGLKGLGTGYRRSWQAGALPDHELKLAGPLCPISPAFLDRCCDIRQLWELVKVAPSGDMGRL